MKNLLVILFVLLLSTSAARAQSEPSVETQRAEMKKIENLIGQWKGSGWIQRGKEKETFNGTETVQRKLDGLALLVEGKFKNKEGIVTHETLAVLSSDLKTKTYRFNTYLASGNKGEYEFKSTADGWQWGIQFPGGSIRFITKLTDDTWFETGESSQDGGKTWRKYFEMSLKKVK